MSEQRHWIDNVADVVSGRIYNTLVSLSNRLQLLENTMTKNQQTIHEAAQVISGFQKKIANIESAQEALLAKIDELEGVTREDLSDELAELNSAITETGSALDAVKLDVAPAGTPADGSSPAVSTDPVVAPIDHSQSDAVTPLGSPTDAGAPTSVPAPGTGVQSSDQSTTPTAPEAPVEEGGPEPVATDPGDVGTSTPASPAPDDAIPTTPEGGPLGEQAPPTPTPDAAPEAPATPAVTGTDTPGSEPTATPVGEGTPEVDWE